MKKTEMIHGEMVEVTIQMAEEWLEKNLTFEAEGDVRNRKLRINVADKYRRIMERGKWNELNGETIKFDCDGNLIDGQHRLFAQIKYGKTMWWFVAYNCRRDAFKTIDNGSNRKAPDMLSIKGHENCNVLAATLGLASRYKDGTIAKAGRNGLSNQDVYDLVGQEPGIVGSVSVAIENKGPKGFLATSIAAFIHYMGSKGGNSQLADNFVKALCRGDHCENDQPITMLRKKLVENLVASKKANRIVVTAWCVKAWNAYYEGRTLSPSSLRYRSRPTKDEDGRVIQDVESFPSFANI